MQTNIQDNTDEWRGSVFKLSKGVLEQVRKRVSQPRVEAWAHSSSSLPTISPWAAVDSLASPPAMASRSSSCCRSRSLSARSWLCRFCFLFSFFRLFFERFPFWEGKQPQVTVLGFTFSGLCGKMQECAIFGGSHREVTEVTGAPILWS